MIFRIAILSTLAALVVAIILGLTVGTIGAFWGTAWAIWLIGSMLIALIAYTVTMLW